MKFLAKSLLFILLLIAVLAAIASWWWNKAAVVPGELAAIDAELGPVFSEERIEKGRERLLLERPQLLQRFVGGKTFGGESSRHTAQHMFGRHEAGIKDVRKKTDIIEVAPRSWLIRLPVVNVVAFETDEGFVVVDTGYGPGGPALVDALKSISDQPIHTILYTHGHVDHAFGTWALMEAYQPKQIIAQNNIEARFDRYIKLRGSLAKYMSQPLEELPKSREDIVWPTRLFDKRLSIHVGGEEFLLVHHRAETDDQFYVWAPGRKALASADYYQAFLPNLGNGKRVQRYAEDWVAAFREMADLGAEFLLPAHGEEVKGRANIAGQLNIHADAIEHVIQHVFAGLNQGLTEDQILHSLDWPERFADSPWLNFTYVTPQNIAQMLLKQYTGWWNDIPSHWSPAPLSEQGKSIVALAGGMEAFLSKVREVQKTDLRNASHLIDWAYYAEPMNSQVHELILDIYSQRLLAKGTPTQEALAYLDHMAFVRRLMMETSASD